MINKLKKIAPVEKQRIQERLYQQLFANQVWSDAEFIGITIAQGYEWDTWPIIEQAWFDGKKVVVPKCYPEEHRLKFYQLDDAEQLVKGHVNILEPVPERSMAVTEEQIDLMLVPGIVFDKQNYRIGHGGGYYDRLLVGFSGSSVALAWRNQVIDSVPREHFDQPVNLLIIDQ